MRKAPFAVALLAALTLALPTWAQNGPSQAEIDQAAAQGEASARQDVSGGPPPIDINAGDMGPSTIPQIPGIPAEARAKLGDKPLIEIYCLMTKWKTGEFFAMLDSVGTNLKPATDKAKDLGVEIAFPDLENLRSQGQAKIDAICAAPNLEAADAGVRDFTTFGESVRSQFAAMRTDLQTKMQRLGDELRQKVEDGIAPLVASEKARVQDEIDTWAKAQAATMSDSLTAEANSQGFTSAEAAQSFIQSRVASLKTSLTSQIQAKVEVEKKAIQTKIQAKVDEIVGPEKAKLEAVGAAFNDMGTKIQAGITSGKAKYGQYRDQAFAKRKAVALGLVDAQITAAKAELEKNRAEFDKIKAEDPSAKGLSDIYAEMNADRAVLSTKLDAALASENETAFNAALTDFQGKWENYRTASEKAFMSPARVCGLVKTQVAAARPQIQVGIKNISDLVQGCAADPTKQGCDKVQELSARFSTITSKLTAIDGQMTFLETLCQKSEARGKLDPEMMTTLEDLKKLGEDAQVYGAALEAEKAAAQAEAVTKAKEGCAQALPQIQAGKLEIADGLKKIDASIKACVGKTNDPECTAVAGLQGRFDSIKSYSARLGTSMTKLENACAKVGPDTPPDQILTLFQGWKDQRDQIDSDVKEIRYMVDSANLATNVCSAATSYVDAANRDMGVSMDLMRQKRSQKLNPAITKCAKTPTAVGCDSVKTATAKITDLESRYTNYANLYWSFHKLCVLSYGSDATRAQVPRDGVLAQVKELQRLGTEFKSVATEFQAAMSKVEASVK